jgi:hypothetical protein
VSNNTQQLPAEAVKEIENNAKLRLIRNGNTSFYRGYYSGEISGATEYATKLHQAQQEIESLTNQLKNHSKVADENMKVLRQENEDKDLLIEMYNIKHNKGRALLEKFISRHEAGLLPDRFIYDEIKTFLK